MYVDMSGGVNDPKDRHFIMAGVAVRENAIYHVIRELDDKIWSSGLDLPPDVELHGVDIVRGKKLWRRIPTADRITFYKQCLDVFHGPSARNLRCFGMVMEKEAMVGEDIAEHAYEQICSRFNSYLRRLFVQSKSRSRGGYKHHGLLIVDESRYAGLFRNLATEYRVNGAKWGQLQNLAEVPMFAPSHATRLLQLADLVSYALWQRYEREDSQYFKRFVSAFDFYNSVYHGLYHYKKQSTSCECPGCGTRQRS